MLNIDLLMVAPSFGMHCAGGVRSHPPDALERKGCWDAGAAMFGHIVHSSLFNCIVHRLCIQCAQGVQCAQCLLCVCSVYSVHSVYCVCAVCIVQCTSKLCTLHYAVHSV